MTDNNKPYYITLLGKTVHFDTAEEMRNFLHLLKPGQDSGAFDLLVRTPKTGHRFSLCVADGESTLGAMIDELQAAA